MATFTITNAKRLRNTTVGNPMWELTLVQENAKGQQIVCRNKPNSGFIYGLQVEGKIKGKIEGTLRTTKGGRVYLVDATNVK
jgi:hypothetical protein